MSDRATASSHGSSGRHPESELVQAAQRGDELASAELVRRYRALVRGRARHYFLMGGDREDVTQEGLVGLLKAIRDFDPSREASFHSFAELCVTRQIISAVKSSTRLKHAPLNAYVSLGSPISDDEGGDRLLSDIIAARGLCDPAELVMDAWKTEHLCELFVGSLSSFECDVLKLHLSGQSYQAIAEKLGRHTKAIDNALQRVKHKMEVLIRETELST